MQSQGQNPQPQGQSRQGKGPMPPWWRWISLQLGEPQLHEGGWWKVPAMIVVEKPGRKPAENEDLIFILDGEEAKSADGKPVLTNHAGRAAEGFTILTDGAHTFEVQIAGTTFRDRIEIHDTGAGFTHWRKTESDGTAEYVVQVGKKEKVRDLFVRVLGTGLREQKVSLWRK